LITSKQHPINRESLKLLDFNSLFVGGMSNKKKRKKKEILVDTFFLKSEEEILKDTTGLESYTISKISTKIGRYLSWFMTGIGALALFFSLYLLVDTNFSFQGFEIVLTSIIGSLGALNVFCGLLLLAKRISSD